MYILYFLADFPLFFAGIYGTVNVCRFSRLRQKMKDSTVFLIFNQSHFLPWQIRGISRWIWHFYAYTTALGLLVLLTGGIGLLYLVTKVERLKHLLQKTSVIKAKRTFAIQDLEVH